MKKLQITPVCFDLIANDIKLMFIKKVEVANKYLIKHIKYSLLSKHAK